MRVFLLHNYQYASPSNLELVVVFLLPSCDRNVVFSLYIIYLSKCRNNRLYLVKSSCFPKPWSSSFCSIEDLDYRRVILFATTVAFSLEIIYLPHNFQVLLYYRDMAIVVLHPLGRGHDRLPCHLLFLISNSNSTDCNLQFFTI
jgi:hypothetical protein